MLGVSSLLSGTDNSTPGLALTYECRLDPASDAAPWQSCTSPFSATVRPGDHAFEARATDLRGNTDPSPAVAQWTFERIRSTRRHPRRP